MDVPDRVVDIVMGNVVHHVLVAMVLVPVQHILHLGRVMLVLVVPGLVLIHVKDIVTEHVIPSVMGVLVGVLGHVWLDVAQTVLDARRVPVIVPDALGVPDAVLGAVDVRRVLALVMDVLERVVHHVVHRVVQRVMGVQAVPTVVAAIVHVVIVVLVALVTVHRIVRLVVHRALVALVGVMLVAPVVQDVVHHAPVVQDALVTVRLDAITVVNRLVTRPVIQHVQVRLSA